MKSCSLHLIGMNYYAQLCYNLRGMDGQLRAGAAPWTEAGAVIMTLVIRKVSFSSIALLLLAMWRERSVMVVTG